MKKLAIFIVVALLLVLCAAPAYAIPVLPHAFYGTVKINDSPAPGGTQISATVDEGVTLTTNKNPVATVNGNYGIDGPHLLVQGDGLSGAITFYVNGVEVEGVTATFEAGGGPTRRDLSVTIAAPPPPGVTGVGALAPRLYADTTLFGIEASFRISDTGKLLETIEATSADGMLTITIPKGTFALDEDGNPLEALEVAIDPDPPEDSIIGLAYDFGPDGATFEPDPITFVWSYDPDALPEGVAEEDLVVAYYDEDLGVWVPLDCEVDTENNIITAWSSHFTTFAIIARAVPVPPPPPVPAAFSLSNLTVKPLEVQLKEAVTITVSVANTGGTEGSYSVALLINGVKEAEKRATVAAGESQLVSFTVAKEEAGSYSVVVDGLRASFTVIAPAPPPAPPPVPVPEVKPFPWPVVGGIIAGVVILTLLVFFFVIRPRIKEY